MQLRRRDGCRNIEEVYNPETGNVEQGPKLRLSGLDGDLLLYEHL